MSAKFKYFNGGKVVVLDKEHQKNILAIIQFIPLDKITWEEHNNLDTVSTFVHWCKDFLNPVFGDHCWGGEM
jgi:hypothetical protein